MRCSCCCGLVVICGAIGVTIDVTIDCIGWGEHISRWGRSRSPTDGEKLFIDVRFNS